MRVNRRTFLGLLGAAAIPAACGRTRVAVRPVLETLKPRAPDVVVTIGLIDLEIAPGRTVRTTGYGDQIPGPTLRLREGKPITIEVRNRTHADELVHWHGLIVPNTVDGVGEVGTPPVPAGGSRRYTLIPKPAGTRWYHTHVAGGRQAARGTFTGQFGFLIVEPAAEPARYDREVLLAIHEWEPKLVLRSGHSRQGAPTLTQPVASMEKMMQSMMGRMGTSAHGMMAPMMGNPYRMRMMAGLQMEEAEYAAFSINGRVLGYGEPVKVRAGERVLFRILNASATLTHRLALPGHRFTIVALDGNSVPNPQTVDVLELGPGERIDALAEVNHPGIWIFGSTQDGYRENGLGIVVEYSGRAGKPQWAAPPNAPWDYTRFANPAVGAGPDTRFELMIEQVMGSARRWTINGRSYPDAEPLVVERGRRYRIAFSNMSMMEHPMHLHGHRFELVALDGTPAGGLFKDTVVVRPMMGRVEVDLVPDNPGRFLLHCHNALHMDGGLATLLTYA